MRVWQRRTPTEQYDDADEDEDDGSCPQAGGRHRPQRRAVPVLVAGTHLHLDDRLVGQRRVARIHHDDGHLVHARLQVHLVAQPQAAEIACIGRVVRRGVSAEELIGQSRGSKRLKLGTN